MTINDFVEALTKATHPRLTKVQVRALLNAFIKIVRDLPVGEQLILNRFGAFRKHVNSPRIIYTLDGFQEGSVRQYVIPPTEVVKFRAFSAAKKRVAREARAK